MCQGLNTQLCFTSDLISLNQNATPTQIKHLQREWYPNTELNNSQFSVIWLARRPRGHNIHWTAAQACRNTCIVFGFSTLVLCTKPCFALQVGIRIRVWCRIRMMSHKNYNMAPFNVWTPIGHTNWMVFNYDRKRKVLENNIIQLVNHKFLRQKYGIKYAWLKIHFLRVFIN